MEPSIKRSVTEGVKASNRALPGIACYALGILLIFAVLVLSVMSTGVPPELLQPDTQTQALPGDEFAADAAAVDEIDEEAIGEEIAAEEESQDYLTEGEETGAVVATAEDERLAQAADAWVGRAWPVLLFALLLALAGGLWLNGGQISYMSLVVRSGAAAPISEFWQGANKAFVRLLTASLLSIPAVVVIGLLFVLPFAGLVAAGESGGALWGVVGVLFMLAVVVGLVWLGVKLVFWFVAVVADGLSPINGLKASFRVTQGRWWKTWALGLVVGFAALVAGLVFQLLGAIGGWIGGPVGTAWIVLVTIVAALANMYVMQFVLLGAYLRYYEDAKTAAPATAR